MKRRQGFTLVEMLVTLALVLFIMVILSEAFSQGLGTFRQLKAVGDMQEKLRSVSIILRHDLQNHYLAYDSSGTVPPVAASTLPPLTLDDPTFGPPTSVTPGTYHAPTYGFFRIEQLAALAATAPTTLPYYVQEGTDPQGVPSLRSADSHRLYFTVRIPATGPSASQALRREGFLSANVPPTLTDPAGTTPPVDKLDSLGPPDYRYNPNTGNYWGSGVYYSRSAEVAYFLRPLGNSTPGATQSNPSGTATPLFALYRRQLVLMDGWDGPPTDDYKSANAAPVGSAANAIPATSIPNYHDVSCRPSTTTPPTLIFNGLSDVTNAGNRCLTCNPSFSSVGYDGAATYPYPKLGERGESANLQGDDLLLSNVVSFSVRILKAGATDFENVMDETSTSSGANAGIYDTANIGSASGSPNYRIAALEITLRVWDIKTQQTRQTTIVQDMGGLNSPSTP